MGKVRSLSAFFHTIKYRTIRKCCSSFEADKVFSKNGWQVIDISTDGDKSFLMRVGKVANGSDYGIDSLNCNSRTFANNDFDWLGDMLGDRATTLRTLNMKDCGIRSSCIEGIARSRCIGELNLSSNGLSGQVSAISYLIQVYTNETLSVYICDCLVQAFRVFDIRWSGTVDVCGGVFAGVCLLTTLARWQDRRRGNLNPMLLFCVDAFVDACVYAAQQFHPKSLDASNQHRERGNNHNRGPQPWLSQCDRYVKL